MGILDHLGSLTMAAGEELPGITQRATAKSVQKVNAAIGADFEQARVAGDVDLMTKVMNDAKAGAYNIGNEPPSPEVFNVMSEGITGYKNDDYTKTVERLKARIAANPYDVDAKLELAKYTAKESGQPMTDDEENKAREDLTAQTQNLKSLEAFGVAEAELGVEEAEIDVKAKRKAFETGPQRETQIIKQTMPDGSTKHILVDKATGETIKDLSLTGDNAEQLAERGYAGELGGKKLTAEQLRKYEGLNSEQRKKTAQVATGNQMISRLENLLDDEEVASHLGRWGGTISDFKAMLTGSSWLPEKVIRYNAILYDMVDLSLRERSGAAVKEEEVYAEMERIIGGTTTSPKAIKFRLNERRLTNIDRVKNFTGGAINFAEMEDVGVQGSGATGETRTEPDPTSNINELQAGAEQDSIEIERLNAAIAQLSGQQ